MTHWEGWCPFCALGLHLQIVVHDTVFQNLRERGEKHKVQTSESRCNSFFMFSNRDWDRHADRLTDSLRDKETKRATETERDRDRQRKRKTNKQRQTDRQTDWLTDREINTHTENEDRKTEKYYSFDSFSFCAHRCLPVFNTHIYATCDFILLYAVSLAIKWLVLDQHQMRTEQVWNLHDAMRRRLDRVVNVCLLP